MNKALQIPEQAFVSNFSNVHASEPFVQSLLRGDLVFLIMQEINNIQSEAYPIDLVGPVRVILASNVLANLADGFRCTGSAMQSGICKYLETVESL